MRLSWLINLSRIHFFTIYERDSDTFKLLNYLDRTSLTGYKNMTSLETVTSKSRLIFFSIEKKKKGESHMFFLILLSYYSFYIIIPWCDANQVSKKELLLRCFFKHFTKFVIYQLFSRDNSQWLLPWSH